MNDPKLFSQKSLFVWLMAALFAVGLGALPAPAQPLSLLENSFYTAYKSQPDIYQALDSLVSARPALASSFSIGKSYEGRDIRALRLTNSAITSPKRQFVIDAGYQGREWAAISTCVYLIKKFVESPALLDSCEIYFIPLVNGDGYAYSQDSDRLYLKNRGGAGVDLQRNFNFHWGEVGGSNTPSSNDYRGPSAASEPETQVMQNFFATLTNFKGYINLGCYGQTLTSPWGWSTNDCPDAAAQSTMMESMAGAIAAANAKQYSWGARANLLPPQSGNSVDYVYGAHHVAHAYYLKLRDTGQYQYTLPANQLIPLGEEIFAGVKLMIDSLCSTNG